MQHTTYMYDGQKQSRYEGGRPRVIASSPEREREGSVRGAERGERRGSGVGADSYHSRYCALLDRAVAQWGNSVRGMRRTNEHAKPTECNGRESVSPTHRIVQGSLRPLTRLPSHHFFLSFSAQCSRRVLHRPTEPPAQYGAVATVLT